MVFFDYTASMKKTAALITYAAALLLAPQFAMAAGAVVAQKQPATDPGSCYSVGNADARAYCLARAHRDPGRCYNVQASDLRSICLAEVRR